MGMYRRGFLKLATVGGVGLVLTPHAALHHVQFATGGPVALGPLYAEAQARTAAMLVQCLARDPRFRISLNDAKRKMAQAARVNPEPIRKLIETTAGFGYERCVDLTSAED